ncbi:hypothetical protein [Methylobacterium oryzisoli]|uniref:hypothetical protein n=1 Tax=Methylobacterium oryzisoli TaxID=3385502 RepID=UPI00389268C2
MSSLHKRSAARLPTPDHPPLVPPGLQAGYAEAMARIPRVRLDGERPTKTAETLPAVSSFYA